MARARIKGPKKDVTLSFKVTGETDERLRAVAAWTKLTPSALAIAAVDAVLSAIERDRGIVFPVEMRFEMVRRPAVAFTEPQAGPTAWQLLEDAKRRQATSTTRRRRDTKRDVSHEAAGSGPVAKS